MEATVLLSFWALCLLLSVSPGPDWAFVLGHALRGRGIALPLAGIALGYLGLTAVVAAGLGAVIASRPALLTVITVLGSLVLAYLGWTMLRSALTGPAGPTAGSGDVVAADVVDAAAPESPTQATGTGGGVSGGAGTLIRPRVTTPAPTARRRLAVLLQGATVSGLNPKGLMLFVALLPQFVSPAATWPAAGQMLVLGLVFIASALAVYSLLGFFARAVLAGSARAARVLTGVAGGAMLVLAAGMLGQHLLG